MNVSHLFAELEVGFEEIDDGLWNVYFGPLWLGRLQEGVGRIVDQLGRSMRRSGDNHKGGTTKKCYPSPEYVTHHLDRSAAIPRSGLSGAIALRTTRARARHPRAQAETAVGGLDPRRTCLGTNSPSFALGLLA